MKKNKFPLFLIGLTTACVGLTPITSCSSTKPTITLDKTELLLYTTQTAVLTPKVEHSSNTVKWTSSNSNVATVKDGIVVAVSAGTATITATIADGISATCAVTVEQLKATSIKATFKTDYQAATVGQTLSENLFNVDLVYNSGKTEALAYDETATQGFNIEYSTTYTRGYTFGFDDISKEDTIKFKFKDFTQELKYTINYSGDVQFYLTGAKVVADPIINVGEDAIITYKPQTEDYYTNLEKTGVEIDGKTYPAYEQFGDKIKFEYVTNSNDDRTIKMIVDKSIVTTNKIKIKLSTDDYSNCGVLYYEPADEHCTLEGINIRLYDRGTTTFGELTKPTVKPIPEGSYIFERWIDTQALTITDDFVLTEETTVAKALCTASKYTITIQTDAHCKASIDSFKVADGQKWGEVKNRVAIEVADHFEFDKWLKEDGSELTDDTLIDSDITVKATTKEIKSYKITFLPGAHGSLLGWSSEIVEEDSTWGEAVKPKVVSDEGFSFQKWVDNSTDEPIAPDTHILRDYVIRAEYQNTEQLPFSLEFLQPNSDTDVTRSKDYYGNTRGSHKDLLYSETLEGYDTGKKWAQRPEWYEPWNRLTMGCNTNWTNDFRFVSHMIKVSIPVNKNTGRKVTLSFDMNVKYIVESAIIFKKPDPCPLYSTYQMFDCKSTKDHPEFYTNFESYDDQRGVDPKCKWTHRYCEPKIESSDKKGWTRKEHGKVLFDDYNDSQEEVKVFEHYVMISILVDGSSGTFVKQGETQFFFTLQEGEQQ